MLVLPEYNRPYILDSLTAPVVIKHNWMFNGPMCDFVLSPILYLEETSGPAVKVRINNSEFWIPESWKILVTDTETYQLDTVNISSCANIQHQAFAFVADELKLKILDISVIDHIDNMSVVHPMINKGMSLVHPVGPELQFGKNGKQLQLSVIIGPHDLYKFLAGKVVGDLFS